MVTICLFLPMLMYLAIHQENIKKKNYSLNIGGTDERDLEEAIQNSLKGGHDHPGRGN